MKSRTNNWRRNEKTEPVGMTNAALIGYMGLLAAAFICWVIVTKDPEPLSKGTILPSFMCSLN